MKSSEYLRLYSLPPFMLPQNLLPCKAHKILYNVFNWLFSSCFQTEKCPDAPVHELGPMAHPGSWKRYKQDKWGSVARLTLVPTWRVKPTQPGFRALSRLSETAIYLAWSRKSLHSPRYKMLKRVIQSIFLLPNQIRLQQTMKNKPKE